MKKTILIPLLLAASTVVQAGTLQASSSGTSTNIDSADCSMVQTAFDLKLSQNVGAAWTCTTTTAAVNAGSTKGTSTYGGSTAGGTIAKCATAVSTTNGYGLTPAAATDGCN